MKNMNPYLQFAGTCEDALNFYKHALGGEIVAMQRFGDAPIETLAEQKNHIMYAEFKSDDLYFMASDGIERRPLGAANVALCLNVSDETEQTMIFTRLSNGGVITVPLQDAFWGARFGELTDKFGIHWMVSCEKTA